MVETSSPVPASQQHQHPQQQQQPPHYPLHQQQAQMYYQQQQSQQMMYQPLPQQQQQQQHGQLHYPHLQNQPQQASLMSHYQSHMQHPSSHLIYQQPHLQHQVPQQQQQQQQQRLQQVQRPQPYPSQMQQQHQSHLQHPQIQHQLQTQWAPPRHQQQRMQMQSQQLQVRQQQPQIQHQQQSQLYQQQAQFQQQIPLAQSPLQRSPQQQARQSPIQRSPQQQAQLQQQQVQQQQQPVHQQSPQRSTHYPLPPMQPGVPTLQQLSPQQHQQQQQQQRQLQQPIPQHPLHQAPQQQQWPQHPAQPFSDPHQPQHQSPEQPQRQFQAASIQQPRREQAAPLPSKSPLSFGIINICSLASTPQEESGRSAQVEDGQGSVPGGQLTAAASLSGDGAGSKSPASLSGISRASLQTSSSMTGPNLQSEGHTMPLQGQEGVAAPGFPSPASVAGSAATMVTIPVTGVCATAQATSTVQPGGHIVAITPVSTSASAQPVSSSNVMDHVGSAIVTNSVAMFGASISSTVTQPIRNTPVIGLVSAPTVTNTTAIASAVGQPISTSNQMNLVSPSSATYITPVSSSAAAQSGSSFAVMDLVSSTVSKPEVTSVAPASTSTASQPISATSIMNVVSTTIPNAGATYVPPVSSITAAQSASTSTLIDLDSNKTTTIPSVTYAAPISSSLSTQPIPISTIMDLVSTTTSGAPLSAAATPMSTSAVTSSSSITRAEKPSVPSAPPWPVSSMVASSEATKAPPSPDSTPESNQAPSTSPRPPAPALNIPTSSQLLDEREIHSEQIKSGYASDSSEKGAPDEVTPTAAKDTANPAASLSASDSSEVCSSAAQSVQVSDTRQVDTPVTSSVESGGAVSSPSHSSGAENMTTSVDSGRKDAAVIGGDASLLMPRQEMDIMTAPTQSELLTDSSLSSSIQKTASSDISLDCSVAPSTATSDAGSTVVTALSVTEGQSHGTSSTPPAPADTSVIAQPQQCNTDSQNQPTGEAGQAAAVDPSPSKSQLGTVVETLGEEVLASSSMARTVSQGSEPSLRDAPDVTVADQSRTPNDPAVGMEASAESAGDSPVSQDSIESPNGTAASSGNVSPEMSLTSATPAVDGPVSKKQTDDSLHVERQLPSDVASVAPEPDVTMNAANNSEPASKSPELEVPAGGDSQVNNDASSATLSCSTGAPVSAAAEAANAVQTADATTPPSVSPAKIRAKTVTPPIVIAPVSEEQNEHGSGSAEQVSPKPTQDRPAEPIVIKPVDEKAAADSTPRSPGIHAGPMSLMNSMHIKNWRKNLVIEEGESDVVMVDQQKTGNPLFKVPPTRVMGFKNVVSLKPVHSEETPKSSSAKAGRPASRTIIRKVLAPASLNTGGSMQQSAPVPVIYNNNGGKNGPSMVLVNVSKAAGSSSASILPAQVTNISMAPITVVGPITTNVSIAPKPVTVVTPTAATGVNVAPISVVTPQRAAIVAPTSLWAPKVNDSGKLSQIKIVSVSSGGTNQIGGMSLPDQAGIRQQVTVLRAPAGYSASSLSAATPSPHVLKYKLVCATTASPNPIVVQPQVVNSTATNQQKSSILIAHPASSIGTDTSEPAKKKTSSNEAAAASQSTKFKFNSSVLPSYKGPSPPPHLGLPNRKFVCQACLDSFCLPQSLEDHLARKTIHAEYPCPHCKKSITLANMCAVKNHIKLHQNLTAQALSMVKILPLRSLREIVFTHNKSTTSDCLKESEDVDMAEFDVDGFIAGKVVQQKVTSRKLTSFRQWVENGDFKKALTRNCSFCKATYASKTELMKHYTSDKSKQYIEECPTCQMLFPHACALAAHMNSHRRVPPHVCSECGQAYPDWNRLDHHMQMECLCTSRVFLYACPKCEMRTSTKELLIEHMMMHTDSYYKCLHCPMAFKGKPALEAHAKRKHSIEKLTERDHRVISKCMLCYTVFHHKTLLPEQHYRMTHQTALDSAAGFCYRCPVRNCNNMFSQKPILIKHLNASHCLSTADNVCIECGLILDGCPDGFHECKLTYQCHKCGISLKSYPEYCTHMEDQHNMFFMQLDSSGREKSKDTLHPPSSMKNQISAAAGSAKSVAKKRSAADKGGDCVTKQNDPAAAGHDRCSSPSGCPSPKKKVKKAKHDQSTLLRRELVVKLKKLPEAVLSSHKGEEVEVVCSECERKFSSGEKLSEHLKEEHNIVPHFSCMLCGMTYPNDEARQQHIKDAHSGKAMKNVYECWICADKGRVATFRKPIGLKAHFKALHKRCTIDWSRFPDPLKEAETKTEPVEDESAPAPKRLKLANDASYTCSKCTFVSDDKSAFQRHIAHHKDTAETYQCQECGMCFVVLPSLKRHLMMVHKLHDVSMYTRDTPFAGAKTKVAQNGTSESVNPLQCQVCEQVFEDKLMLRKHSRSHGMAFITSKSQAS